jgi:hypothetical protein
MSPRGVARTVAVRATATTARRNVVEMTVPAVAVATPGKGHSQARAVANANLSLPLRIWSGSGNKDMTKEQNAVDVNSACIRKSEPASQDSGMPSCQSLAVNDSMSHWRVSANAAQAGRRVKSRCGSRSMMAARRQP